jgi:hypothetical protein
VQQASAQGVPAHGVYPSSSAAAITTKRELIGMSLTQLRERPASR